MVDGKFVIAIDMLWLRPGRNGGTESYVRNILDGIVAYSSGEYVYYLIASEQNKKSLNHYLKCPYIKIVVTPVNNESQIKRVLWSNLNVNGLIRKYGIDLWFSPVYSKPFKISKIPCVTSIMDVQAMHYPEYFSKGRNMYFRTSWKQTCKTSDLVVTISDFCKEDLQVFFGISEDRVKVIYPAIKVEEAGRAESETLFNELRGKYGITDKRFYYTVSSLAKHKNVFSILRMMKVLKEKDPEARLVITGVNVNASEEIKEYVKANDLSSNVVFTGFISNEERDCLYDHCNVFLYPSIFEGFGMPVIEAMERGIPVVTTKYTSLYEVTQGKAFYVEDPYDELEWEERVLEAEIVRSGRIHFKEYETETIIGQYEEAFADLLNRS